MEVTTLSFAYTFSLDFNLFCSHAIEIHCWSSFRDAQKKNQASQHNHLCLHCADLSGYSIKNLLSELADNFTLLTWHATEIRRWNSVCAVQERLWKSSQVLLPTSFVSTRLFKFKWAFVLQKLKISHRTSTCTANMPQKFTIGIHYMPHWRNHGSRLTLFCLRHLRLIGLFKRAFVLRMRWNFT